MGSQDGTKIALGLFASTSVVILSYILLKKYGFRASRSKLDEKECDDLSQLSEQGPNISANQIVEEPVVQASVHARPLEASVPPAEAYDKGGDNGQNLTSFIVLGDSEGAALLEGDNGAKKSDRSSDESSYDVIEDDRMADTVDDDEDVADESASDRDTVAGEPAGGRQELESSLETSMVVVEEAERSNVEKSGSSFYTSADEHFGLSHLEETSKPEEQEGVEEEEEEKDGQRVMELSITEDETVVMYKSTSGENDSLTLEDKDSANDVTPVAEEFVVAGKETSDEGESQSHIDDPVVQERLNSLAITDAVLRADLEAASAVPTATPEAQAPPPQEAERELDLEAVTQVLSKCQSTPISVTREDILLLGQLLRRRVPELQATVLNSIVRVAAFNQNTTTLRESGLPEEIVQQVRATCEAAMLGEVGAEATLASLSQVLTNLSMDPKAHPKLEDSIPSLISLLLLDALPESLVLTTLRPLVNLSAEPTYHAYYVRAIPTLLAQLDAGAHMAKVQSLKVLVNLSLDEEMVPHLLMAKAPFCLLSLLAAPAQNDVILRTVTMLANVFTTMHEKSIGPDTFPTSEGADLSQSMYTALTEPDRVVNLRSKVFRLTRHDDEDVCYQASRLYKHIPELSA